MKTIWFLIPAWFLLCLSSCFETPTRPASVTTGQSQNAEGTPNNGSAPSPGPESSPSASNPSSPSASPSPGSEQMSPSPSSSSPASEPMTPMTPAASNTGLLPVMASSGCNKEPTQELAKYAQKKVEGTSRVYDLYLPAKYDKAKPYRLIVLGHSCGGEFVPFKMETVSKGEAIIATLRSVSSQGNGKYVAGCFTYTMKAEGDYFDQVLKQVESETCVDTNRVFLAGFSSGAWLTNMLGCARGGVIRAQGTAAGGLPGLPTCAKPLAAMFIHDKDDKENVIAGSEKSRARILKLNECSDQTEPYDYDEDPKTSSVCVQYKGCKAGYPVVWCPTSGKGHSSNEPLSTVGLWNFWSKL